MKYQKLLSVIPFYGGKGRMAHFIADRLDYMHSDVFVTPFGGGCRVLLNKPRHPIEIYNDFSSGLCALIRVLSQRDTAIELIQRVMDSEYSREQFEEAKELFDLCETDEEERQRNYIINYLQGIFPHRSKGSLEELFGHFSGDTINPNSHRQIKKSVKDSWIELKERQATDIAFQKQFDSLLKKWLNFYDLKSKYQLPRSNHLYGIDDIDLAVATYIVYTMSRDGMGKVFSESKFRSTEQYHKRAESLFACAERLEGIEVQQLDAFMFFRKEKEIDNDPGKEGRTIGDWLDNPSVMMYLDPSYISPTSEQEALEGIDWQRVDSLSKAVRGKIEKEKRKTEKRKRAGADTKDIKIRKMPQNLGEVYARSFNYEEQENFLRLICNAKCKILISNYDLLLYDKYLTMNGWQRTEFLTSTSVGSRAGNDRTEVIWWNY